MPERAGVDLEASDLTVNFGGVQALSGVSFQVPPGAVYGLIGPNGSGKTTVLNALCGFVKAGGELRLGDRAFHRLPPHRRAALGLGRTFQHPRADPSLTVRDVLRLGEHLRGEQPWWMVTFAPWRADRTMAAAMDRVAQLLARVELDRDILDDPLTSLPAGVAKMIDIVRALLAEPRVLLLDEPSSGMNENELSRLRTVLEELKGGGLTLVLVEHHLRFVSEISDGMTALEGGRVIASGDPQDVLQSDAVGRAYLGVTEADEQSDAGRGTGVLT